MGKNPFTEIIHISLEVVIPDLIARKPQKQREKQRAFTFTHFRGMSFNGSMFEDETYIREGSM